MATILRRGQTQDADALYDIALKTGDAGKDATSLLADGRMVGHVYSVPYLLCGPQEVFVAEDAEGICGYLVGTRDTRAFEQLLEAEWWPTLRAIYPDCSSNIEVQTLDERYATYIHHPPAAHDDIVTQYPAHIHMNLLPRSRGQGAGSALLKLWLESARDCGTTGVHLGANPQNHSGIAFWESRGFGRLGQFSADGEVWFGMQL